MFNTPTRLAFRYRPVFDGLWTPFFILYSNRFRIAQIRFEGSSSASFTGIMCIIINSILPEMKFPISFTG
jgi:hypothetical protein